MQETKQGTRAIISSPSGQNHYI